MVSMSLLLTMHSTVPVMPQPPTAVNVLRYLINPVMSWVVTHGELDVLSPEVVHGLVMDVFQNPEKGEVLNCVCVWRRRQTCRRVQGLSALVVSCCRWPQRADPDGVGAALHHAD